MDTMAIKGELKQRIEMEEDPHILWAIRDFLVQEDDPIYKQKLISRALKAEEDINAGRVYTSQEFKAKIDESIAKRR
jgi:predicted transcriptional regulator